MPEIRYYGWYSNKARGMRRKQAEAAAAEPLAGSSSGETAPAPLRSRASQTWATCLPGLSDVRLVRHCAEVGIRQQYGRSCKWPGRKIPTP